MSLFDELKRRNVIRVAIAYAVTAWLILQVAEVLISLLSLPEQVGRYTVLTLLAGFPLALVFSWLYDLTPEGFRRDGSSDRSEGHPGSGRRRLDFVIVGLLAVAVGYFAWDKFHTERGESARAASGSAASLAVLPFANRGGDADSGLFAGGIHDDLLTQLARVAGLRVISRTSVMEYADRTRNIRDIARELGVSYVLEGGVQHAGSRVRINVQLIEARDDHHLWAETFDRELTPANIFEVQSEIARVVTESLQVALTPESGEALAQARTLGIDAYREYLEGMRILNDQPSRSQREKSIARFRRAVELDPRFALAWVRLADQLRQVYWFDQENQQALDESLAVLQKVEALNPELPELHLVRAKVLYHGFRDYAGALRELEIAERRMPGNDELYYWRGTILRRLLHVGQAITAYTHALELNPRDHYTLWDYVLTLLLDRRYADAREQVSGERGAFAPAAWINWINADIDWYQFGDARPLLEAMRRPDYEPFFDLDRELGVQAWLAGDVPLAQEHLLKLSDEVEAFAGFYRVPEELKGLILAEAGDVEGSRRYLEVALTRTRDAAAAAPSDAPRIQALARTYAHLGRTDEAVAAADRVMALIEEDADPWSRMFLTIEHAQLLCELGDFDRAEAGFRQVLALPNWFTLPSLIRDYPPCGRKFEGSAHYQRLAEEFGHLGQSAADS